MKLRLYVILYIVTVCHSYDSDKSLFPRLPVAPTNSKDELCRSESSLYMESLNNLTLWAYRSEFSRIFICASIFNLRKKMKYGKMISGKNIFHNLSLKK